MKNLLSKMKIFPDISIKEALKKIDEGDKRILFVCDKNGSLLGTLVDGDIRRRILKGGNLKEKIIHCFNRNPVFAMKNNYTIPGIKRLMLEKRIEVIPVVDSQKRIVDVLFWKDRVTDSADGYDCASRKHCVQQPGRTQPDQRHHQQRIAGPVRTRQFPRGHRS